MVVRATDEERRRARRRVAGGFVAVVALSAGTVAAWSGAGPLEVGGVVVAGAIVGVALLLALGG